MGIPGAGKTRLADGYLARGYVRLNRDERGGALRALADELDGQLADGARRVVLDNTYLTRAARSYVIEAAGRHGIPTRCVWLDTPLAQAQVNMVERLLEPGGALPTPEELRVLARRMPGTLAPTQQMRSMRELEPPSIDEGFSAVEVTPFARAPARPERIGAGVFVAAAALKQPGWQRTVAAARSERAAPGYSTGRRRRAGRARPAVALARGTSRDPSTGRVCPHGGGPPRCWCRPPLPGLPLAFAHAHGLHAGHCTVAGTSAAHRTLASTLGARFVPIA